jgi:epoxyqueuosine reductase QueG
MDSILYGCDLCLEACPYFRIDPEARTELGQLGPRLPARFFLEEDDSLIGLRLSDSALGLSWMSIAGFRRCAARAVRRLDARP